MPRAPPGLSDTSINTRCLPLCSSGSVFIRFGHSLCGFAGRSQRPSKSWWISVPYHVIRAALRSPHLPNFDGVCTVASSIRVVKLQLCRCWPDCKPEGPLFSAEFICLCALLPFNVNWFWRNLVTRTLLWSSLAATIMVQIGRRGTAGRLFENSQKFSKITEFEFQNSGPSFFAPVSCIVKKIRLDSHKTDRGDRFWTLPLWQFRQWHCCSRTTLVRIFWLNRRRGCVERWKLGGIPNWGRNRAVKTNRLVLVVARRPRSHYDIILIVTSFATELAIPTVTDVW